MFQIKNRTITLSYSQSEIEEVNGILSELQSNQGVQSETLKGLFLQILRNAAQSVQNSNEIQSSNSESELNLKTEIEAQSLEIAQLLETNKVLTLQIEELENNQDVEIVEVPVAYKPADNHIHLELDPGKVMVLKTISENRFQTKRDAQRLDLSALAMKLIFNKATLYNWGGEIYTGLK